MLDFLLDYSPYKLSTFISDKPVPNYELIDFMLQEKFERKDTQGGSNVKSPYAENIAVLADQYVYEPMRLAGGLENIRKVFEQFRQDEEELCKDNEKRLNRWEILNVFNSLGGRFDSLHQYELYSGISRRTLWRKRKSALRKIAITAQKTPKK